MDVEKKKNDGGLLLRDFFLVTLTLNPTLENPKIFWEILEGSYVT